MLAIPSKTVINNSFRIVSELGVGGMGAVYKAWQLDLDRGVALKFLLPELVSDKQALSRFEREGKILMSLRHRNLVQCYQFGVWRQSYPYIAMELLEGKSFKSLIDETGRVNVSTALEVAIQACEGLSVIHDAGYTHRDLKPENLFIEMSGDRSELVVKVIDFGLAGFLIDSAKEQLKLTQTGALVGSIYYLSPELCCGNVPDARADIYSLGCVVYESVAGEPPLSGDDPIGVIYKHVHEYPPKLADRVRDIVVPAGLDYVLRKAMAKDPAQRYQSAVAFRDDLLAVKQGGSLPPEFSDSIFELPARSAKRRFLLPAMLCLLSFSVLFFSWWVLFTDKGLVSSGRALYGKSDNLSRLSDYCDWLVANHRSTAASLLLHEQVRSLPIGDLDRVRLWLKLCKIQQAERKTSQEKESIRQIVKEFDALPAVDTVTPLFTGDQRAVLREFLSQTESFLKQNSIRWDFDIEFKAAVSRLNARCVNSHDYSTAAMLRQLVLHDDACRMDPRFDAVMRIAFAQVLNMANDNKAAELQIDNAIEVLDKFPKAQAKVSAMLQKSSILRDIGMFEDSSAELKVAAKRVIDDLRTALPDPGDREIVTTFIILVAEKLYDRGWYDDSLRLCRMALDEIERVEPRAYFAESLRLMYAKSLVRVGHSKEALSYVGSKDSHWARTRYLVQIEIHRKENDYRKLLDDQKRLLQFDSARIPKQQRFSADTYGSTNAVVATLNAHGRFRESLNELRAMRAHLEKHIVLTHAVTLQIADTLYFLGRDREAELEYSRAEALLQFLDQTTYLPTSGQLHHAYMIFDAGRIPDAAKLSARVAEMATDPLVRAAAIELEARCFLACGERGRAVSRAQSTLQVLDQFGLNGTRVYLLAQTDLVESFALAGDLKHATEAWQKLASLPAWCRDARDSISVARAGALLGVLSGDARYGRLLRELSRNKQSPAINLNDAWLATTLLEVSALSDEARQFEDKKANTVGELVSAFGKDCPVVRRAMSVRSPTGLAPG
ncbi:MAG: serine/threonine protein kinase [Candidatus Obscuribacterales bacterium]|nr:serine/threonine protein kinase [Candidatus Obscuribacterales bacterium]